MKFTAMEFNSVLAVKGEKEGRKEYVMEHRGTWVS